MILTEADLMPFQRDGVARILQQTRLYLGDDPGLGKTAQIICALKHMPRSVLDKGVLIVVPASLRLNWHREWEIWGGPECEKYIISYNEATNDAQGKAPRKGADRIGVGSRYWGVAVFDEAHALKAGGKSQRAFALVNSIKRLVDKETMQVTWLKSKGVQAERLVFMSGTPILNKPSDIYPLLRHLDPNEWSSKSHFERRYCNAGLDMHGRWTTDGLSHGDELKDKLVNGCKGKPGFLLRRLKRDVLTQLPAKRRQIVEIEVGSRDTKKLNKLFDELAGQGISKKLTDSDSDMRWAVRAMESLKGRLSGHVAEMRRELGHAKIKGVLEALTEQWELGVMPGKLVIFAHHREVVEQLAQGLRDKGIKAQEYYGGMTDVQKNQVVETFQTGDLQVFVGSIMAAGVGLTLTAADTCMIVEPSYVPAENTQAEDRLHRIGALKPVLIQYVVAANTLDSRILELVVNKMEIISQVLS